MLLQKRTYQERHRWVSKAEEDGTKEDPLFERDWEIFVVKRDPETGEFVTVTVAAEEAEKLS